MPTENRMTHRWSKPRHNPRYRKVLFSRPYAVGTSSNRTNWPSENERVMSGKVAILPPETGSKTSVCGTSYNPLEFAISKG